MLYVHTKPKINESGNICKRTRTTDKSANLFKQEIYFAIRNNFYFVQQNSTCTNPSSLRWCNFFDGHSCCLYEAGETVRISVSMTIPDMQSDFHRTRFRNETLTLQQEISHVIIRSRIVSVM